MRFRKLTSLVARMVGSSMEHFAPHTKSTFEGFYSKFDLPSGSHIALIICSVPNAKTRPHMVSFTYYPAGGSPIFQREHWVSDIQRTITGPGHAFELRVPEMGSMTVAADSTTMYSLSCPEWSLEAETTSRTPWHPRKATPEGWLVRLPLPLHWHVHSLASSAAFQLDIPAARIPRGDRHGQATVHQEKNWASSFPASHMWIQARDSARERGVCLAGGKILGMTAYMLGYRSQDLNLDFVPPFAVQVLGLSPFMAVDVDYESRTFCISVSNVLYRLDLRASAPKEGGWFGLGSPFPEGHRRNFCTESFSAEVEVLVFRRGWRGWNEVRKERFEHASLEFAGGYFPDRGEKRE